MNKLIFVVIASFAAVTTQAHDPKENMEKSEKPRCAALKNMDGTNMDTNDPVMQAMMKKCMNHMNNGESEKVNNHQDHDKQLPGKSYKAESHADGGH